MLAASIVASQGKPAQAKQPIGFMSLGQAKLHFAGLPKRERDAVYSSLFRLSKIDGRPVSPIEPMENLKKAQVPLIAVERIKAMASRPDALEKETAAFRERREVVGAGERERQFRVPTDQREKTLRAQYKANQKGIELQRDEDRLIDSFMRDFPGRFKTRAEAIEAREKARLQKDVTVGEELKAGVEQIAGTTARFVSDLYTLDPEEKPYEDRSIESKIVPELIGGIAAIPVSIPERIEFLSDPEYRNKVNPEGTSVADFAGTALMLWMDIGAPGAGKLLAPVGKAVSKTKAYEAVANSKGFNAFKQWLVGEAKAGNISAKEAIDTAKLSDEALAEVGSRQIESGPIPQADGSPMPQTVKVGGSSFKAETATVEQYVDDMIAGKIPDDGSPLAKEYEQFLANQEADQGNALRAELLKRKGAQEGVEKVSTGRTYDLSDVKNDSGQIVHKFDPESADIVKRLESGEVRLEELSDAELNVLQDQVSLRARLLDDIDRDAYNPFWALTEEVKTERRIRSGLEARVVKTEATQKGAQTSTPQASPLKPQKASTGQPRAKQVQPTAEKPLKPTSKVRVETKGNVIEGTADEVNAKLTSDAKAKAKLPKELERSAPRYGYKDKSFTPEFASDYDKAAYIIAGKGTSKSHAKFVKWLDDNGFGIKEATKRGEAIRAEVKAQAAKLESGAPIKVKPQTKIGKALEGADEELTSAFEAMQKARAKQAKALKKGGKQRGSVPNLLKEEVDYFQKWAKKKGLEGAKAVEDFLVHIKEIGEDVAYWSKGLKGIGDDAPKVEAPRSLKQPKVKKEQPPVDGTSPKHAEIDKVRSKYGLDDRKKGTKTDADLYEEVATRKTTENAPTIARKALADERILDDAEQIGAAAHIELKTKELSSLQKAIDAGDEAAIFTAQAIDEDLRVIADALDASGTAAGRAQRARRIVADLLDGGYDIGSLRFRFARTVGRNATKEETKQLVKAANNIEAAEGILKEVTERAAVDKEFVGRLKDTLRDVKPSPKRRIISESAYEAAKKRLQSRPKIGSKQSGSTTIPSNISDLATIVAYHVESGVRELPELIKRVLSDVPGADKGDIHIATQHALDTIENKPGKATEQAKATIKDLRGESKAAMGLDDFNEASAQIDLLESILTDPAKSFDELESAWNDLNKIRAKYNQGSQTAFDYLASGKYGHQAQEVADIRFRIDQSKRKTDRTFFKAREAEELKAMDSGQKAAHYILKTAREVSNLPAQLRASVDASYTFRQGAFFSLNPRYAKQSKAMIRAQLESMGSKEGYAHAAYTIRQNKNYDRFVAAKGILEGEEFAAANAEQFESVVLKILGDKFDNPVQASGRAYEMAGNTHRMVMFDEIVTGAEKLGKELTTDELKMVAEYVNTATGRGQGRGSKALVALSDGLLGALWSPRLLGSRIELLYGRPLIRAVRQARKTGNYHLVKRITQDYMGFYGSVSAIMYGLHLAGADVNIINPHSPDFLKARFGDLRIDLLSGMQQVIRFGVKMGSAMYESATGQGANSFRDAGDLAVDFVRTKASPTHGEAANWLLFDRKSVIGEDVTPASTLHNLTVPLGLSEAISEEALKQPSKAATSFSLNFGGVGTQLYKDRVKPSGGAQPLKKLGGMKSLKSGNKSGK